ncbi:hypothetical protein XFF6990_80158 [Xanthomonas citri pv. fuscans]|uniref:Uncharacterized protein n=1 Tax=Xanthomonas campestris pv. phaseoli TaxID=317013 RepID=A0A7Z7J656_XANCH|nr:hypothetical protein XFF6990_80158 [Xanthomonas citri pv. fuscans]SOO26626.1 hypothetical protein XFF6991_570191 [Xanthomonas phaseoli pv. phaseoli]
MIVPIDCPHPPFGHLTPAGGGRQALTISVLPRGKAGSLQEGGAPVGLERPRPGKPHL